ncbi:MAG: serine hydrolase, partial [Bacillota bacterium]|nr:serine hydrolase [Bacillota bacterium]
MRSSCSDLGDFVEATTGDSTRLVASDVVSEPPSPTSSETLSETSTEITSEISSETSSGISSETSTMTSSETSSVTSSEAATSNALVSGTSSSEDPWVKESEELLASFDRNALSRWTKESDISDEWKSYFAMDNRFVLTFKNYDYLMSLAPSVKRFGVYVEDMKTGKTFTINGDEDFYAASTRKLAICTMGLRLVQDKKMRLDDYVMYNPEWDDEPGASVIQVHSRKGDVFQILTLIDYIGRYSDNIALNMLVRKIIVSGGYEEYKHQMTILTGREFVPENVYTPRQLAHSVKALCVSVAQDPIFEALVYPLEEV